MEWQPIETGTRAGVVLFLIILAFVFATGSTFGQRCTAMGYTGPDHAQCVESFAAARSRR